MRFRFRCVHYALGPTIDGHDEELGLQVTRRNRRCVKHEVMRYFEFTDDMVLFSEATQAQRLLMRVESLCARIALKVNAGKTKFMDYNHHTNINIVTKEGSALEKFVAFK